MHSEGVKGQRGLTKSKGEAFRKVSPFRNAVNSAPIQNTTGNRIPNCDEYQKTWNIINPISERDTNRTACSVLSLYLWLVPCILRSHTCTYTRLHREAVALTGRNSHDKSTVRREGVWVVIQLLLWAHFKTQDRDYTGAHEQSDSSCIERQIIPQWIPYFQHCPTHLAITLCADEDRLNGWEGMKCWHELCC